MFEHTLFFIYKFRHAFVVPLALLILTLTSALVTALGSNTVLAAKTYPHNSTMGASVSDPNFVTDGFSRMMENGERDMVVAGMGVYRACKSVTNTSIRGSRAMAHGTAVAAVGTWHGVAFVGRGIGSGMLFAVRGVGNGLLFTVRGIGSGIMLTLRSIGSAGLFVLRAPGKVVGSVAHAPVNAIIKPPDDKIAPVISSETSAAILTRFNAQQQQQIAALLADQVAANKQLDGAVVAGDPKHGGYPTKWDSPVAQDSLVDSWGMYNRECVSYAAWKVYQTFGTMPNWGGIGNANQWLGNARSSGIATGSTPQAHSVAISMRGYYGHAMWVEAVDGNMVYVSQYNYDLHGNYSEMWVNASQFTYIYFK